MKKILANIIAVTMMLNVGSTYAVAPEKQSHQMDSTDVIITGYSYVADCSSSAKTSNSQISVISLVPLYNLNNEIIAYYVTYSSNEYAVINNNIDNPTAIEFGKGTQQYIEEILSSYQKPKIIYNNPVSVYEESIAYALSSIDGTDMKSIEDYYPELSVKNDALANELKQTKALVEEAGAIKTTRGDGDYGFFSPSDIPSTGYIGGLIRERSATPNCLKYKQI